MSNNVILCGEVISQQNGYLTIDFLGQRRTIPEDLIILLDEEPQDGSEIYVKVPLWVAKEYHLLPTYHQSARHAFPWLAVYLILFGATVAYLVVWLSSQ